MKPSSTLLALVVAAVVALSGAVATSSAHPTPAGPPDSYVTSWDAIGTQAFSAAGLTPAEGHVIFAYVAIAVYDSVMAVEGGYEPFAVEVDAPAGASTGAAVATAAHRVLAHYLPAQVPTILDPAYTVSLATIPDGQAKTDGVAVGTNVADQLIALRTGDGFRVPVTYTPPNPPIPGVWVPTAPSPPLGIYLPNMRPFSLDSADQFRPDGPPALSSKRWARDYNEVKEIGSSTSATRTAEQTVAARFWAEPPVQQARGSFRKFVLDHGLDAVGASRFMAMISVVYADSLIACFDAKYHYAFWRPITAVRAGDTDGNDATVGDPAWTPLLPTPNHPEYPSAHSCITPAGGRVIARFLDTQEIDFTVPSLTGLGDRHFERLEDLQNDVGNGRIWGGIHYRSAVEDGIAIGKRTVQQVLANHFQRSSGSVALTPAAVVNGEVPFQARFSGAAAFTTPTTVEFHGAGHATQLGAIVNSGVAILEPPTGSCPGGTPGIPNVHTETLTAASGDELVIRAVNVACPTGPYTFHGTGHWTVVGGTGRFEDVTGQGTDDGHVDFESNTFELAVTGTLSRDTDGGDATVDASDRTSH